MPWHPTCHPESPIQNRRINGEEKKKPFCKNCNCNCNCPFAEICTYLPIGAFSATILGSTTLLFIAPEASNYVLYSKLRTHISELKIMEDPVNTLLWGRGRGRGEGGGGEEGAHAACTCITARINESDKPNRYKPLSYLRHTLLGRREKKHRCGFRSFRWLWKCKPAASEKIYICTVHVPAQVVTR